jgi:hypothetical protein
MKLIFTALFVVVATIAFSQTIYRVNNNPGVTGTNVYNSLQGAHDAATGGDIIYVEPSVTYYGSLNCTKQLTIIGPGYYLPSATSLNAKSNQAIVFSAGSEGSSLMGFQVENNGYVEVNLVSNITITRCLLSFVWLKMPTVAESYSNIIISQSATQIFDNPFSGSAPSPLGSVTAVQINNNIIIGGPFLGSAYSGTFTNNTQLGYNHLNISNFTLSNNIFGKGGYSFSGSNNTSFNNVASENQFGTNDGNLANVDMNTVFVLDQSVGLSAGFTEDSRYQIKEGSPTIGAGFGGVDCGAFGGATPYVLSGIPPYPTITKLLNSSTGNSTTPVSVTISTKSNN